jgi:hypothetical protein
VNSGNGFSETPFLRATARYPSIFCRLASRQVHKYQPAGPGDARVHARFFVRPVNFYGLFFKAGGVKVVEVTGELFSATARITLPTMNAKIEHPKAKLENRNQGRANLSSGVSVTSRRGSLTILIHDAFQCLSA